MRIKLFFILIFCFCSSIVWGQKYGKVYYSYPKPRIEIKFNDTSMFWKMLSIHVGIDSGAFYATYRKGDTLFIVNEQKNFYDIYGKYVLFKRNYAIVCYDSSCLCGMLFKIDNQCFRLKNYYLRLITTHNKISRKYEIVERRKAKKIFKNKCNNELPEVGGDF